MKLKKILCFILGHKYKHAYNVWRQKEYKGHKNWTWAFQGYICKRCNSQYEKPFIPNTTPL